MLKHGFMPSLFQSTPPVKAATDSVAYPAAFNSISIHAAREGGDFMLKWRIISTFYFNPRRP